MDTAASRAVVGRFYAGHGLSEPSSASYFAGIIGDESVHLSANPRWARSNAMIEAGDLLPGVVEARLALHENAVWLCGRMGSWSKGDLERAKAGSALERIDDAEFMLGASQHDVEMYSHVTATVLDMAQRVKLPAVFLDLEFRQICPRLRAGARRQLAGGPTDVRACGIIGLAASERAIELQPNDPDFVDPYICSATSLRLIGEHQRSPVRIQRARSGGHLADRGSGRLAPRPRLEAGDQVSRRSCAIPHRARARAAVATRTPLALSNRAASSAPPR